MNELSSFSCLCVHSVFRNLNIFIQNLNIHIIYRYIVKFFKTWRWLSKYVLNILYLTVWLCIVIKILSLQFFEVETR